MTLRFRNVDADASAPVEEWPAEAIEIALDRGSLGDWARLANAIRRDPWGRVARLVETVTGWQEHYGVDALMQRVIARAREELTLSGRAAYAKQIHRWREEAGMTMREFAQAAGTSASRLSDYENAKVAPTTDVLGRLRHVARLHAQEAARDSVRGEAARGRS